MHAPARAFFRPDKKINGQADSDDRTVQRFCLANTRRLKSHRREGRVACRYSHQLAGSARFLTALGAALGSSSHVESSPTEARRRQRGAATRLGRKLAQAELRESEIMDGSKERQKKERDGDSKSRRDDGKKEDGAAPALRMTLPMGPWLCGLLLFNKVVYNSQGRQHRN